jgi:PadR family transcriptional regulator, regulatory protein PadR
MARRDQFSGHLDMLLLAALRERSLHGYAIIDRIRTTSANRFDYPEGTVYPALHRLEAEGLLRSKWSDVDGRRRRAYELTARGRKSLQGRETEWETFAATIRAVLDQ